MKKSTLRSTSIGACLLDQLTLTGLAGRLANSAPYCSSITKGKMRKTKFEIRLEMLVWVGVLILLTHTAYAGRLESAARNAQSTVLQIAQVSSGIGIGLGAIFYQIGFSQVGRQILISALIGVFATVGGPAIISAIQSLF